MTADVWSAGWYRCVACGQPTWLAWRDDRNRAAYCACQPVETNQPRRTA